LWARAWRRASAEVGFLAGQTKDAAAVGELHAELGFVGAADRPADAVVGVEDLAENLLALALAGGEQQHVGFRLQEGGVQGQGGRDGRFSGLAAAVEEDFSLLRQQNVSLPGVRFEAACPENQGGIRREVCGFHGGDCAG